MRVRSGDARVWKCGEIKEGDEAAHARRILHANQHSSKKICTILVGAHVNALGAGLHAVAVVPTQTAAEPLEFPRDHAGVLHAGAFDGRKEVVVLRGSAEEGEGCQRLLSVVAFLP